MTAPLQLLLAGDSPLIINIPHAGTALPPALTAVMTEAAIALPDTDWHLPFLYHFAVYQGASLMAATHSRYVIDLNRDPDGQPLYPGLDNSELCPLTTFSHADIYQPGCAPDAAEIENRRARYWQPYHDELTRHVARLHERHGYVVLLDAHSVRSEVPRLFDGRLPDLNLGTADGRSCAPSLRMAAAVALEQQADFSRVLDGRFKGGYITRHYGIPEEGLHALQLEIVQACYMDEDRPLDWTPAQANRLQPVLRRLVDTLLGWQPKKTDQSADQAARDSVPSL